MFESSSHPGQAPKPFVVACPMLCLVFAASVRPMCASKDLPSQSESAQSRSWSVAKNSLPARTCPVIASKPRSPSWS